MPRKPKCRFIGSYPDHWCFSAEDPAQGEPIVLTLDEYEAVRLIDYEGLSQERCAEQMRVARTTVTSIYGSARRKLASMLVEGRMIRIAGGCCEISPSDNIQIAAKEENTMRIAVTYENGEIFQHFGHTEAFKIYDVEDGKIVSEQIVDTNGNGHGALAGFLKSAGVDALICGGIGMGAQNALAEAGIALYGGVSGNADAAARALAEDALIYDPDAHCDHHDHHHGEGGGCGRHGSGCGNHSCHN